MRNTGVVDYFAGLKTGTRNLEPAGVEEPDSGEDREEAEVATGKFYDINTNQGHAMSCNQLNINKT